MTVGQLLRYLKENGKELVNTIQIGEYKPQPIRRVEIPKDSAYKMLVLDYCIKSKRLHRYGGSLLEAKKLAEAELLAEKELTEEQQKELELEVAHVEVWGWQGAKESYEVLFVMDYSDYQETIKAMIKDKTFYKAHTRLYELMKEAC